VRLHISKHKTAWEDPVRQNGLYMPKLGTEDLMQYPVPTIFFTGLGVFGCPATPGWNLARNLLAHQDSGNCLTDVGPLSPNILKCMKLHCFSLKSISNSQKLGTYLSKVTAPKWDCRYRACAKTLADCARCLGEEESEVG
jgi:hypothetical protein